MIGKSDGVPLDKVHFFLNLSGTPYEVPLGSINQLMHGSRELDVLHNVVGDAS